MAMKESIISLWNYSSQGWAKRFLLRWIKWVKKSELKPMQKAGEMLKRHFENRRHFKTVIYFFCGGLNLYPEVR
ncbi:MAG: transposase [Victivallales bacterium]|nr:transposase [Victivallales bacterium]